MLEKQRILVILDRLSERSLVSQQYASTVHGSLKVNALVVTTRRDVTFEAAPPVLLYPEPLDSTSLLHFMTSLLREHANRTPSVEGQSLATIKEQLELGKRLAALIQVRGKGDQEVPILPLPVRIFVDDAVDLIHRGHSLENLPASLPEAYFRYLERINPKTTNLENGMSDEAMLRASKLLGRLATECDFIPKEFSRDVARERLRAAGWTEQEKHDPVQRLIDNGVLGEKKTLGFYRLRFELDPIAEFLSAAAWAEECGGDTSLWADLKRRSIGAPGFQIAIRLTLQTCPQAPEWERI